MDPSRETRERGTPERRGERRRAERCRVSFRVLREGDARAPERAETVDLSASGLCLASPRELPRGTPLALEIDLGDGGDRIVAMGEVAWTARREADWRIGVSFSWVRPQDLSMIERLRRHLDS